LTNGRQHREGAVVEAEEGDVIGCAADCTDCVAVGSRGVECRPACDQQGILRRVGANLYVDLAVRAELRGRPALVIRRRRAFDLVADDGQVSVGVK
jgi:hypothetical protein